MTDNTNTIAVDNAATTTVKARASKFDRLKSLASEVAKGISKIQLTPAEISALEDVAKLLLSTVTHSQLLTAAKGSASNATHSEDDNTTE